MTSTCTVGFQSVARFYNPNPLQPTKIKHHISRMTFRLGLMQKHCIYCIYINLLYIQSFSLSKTTGFRKNVWHFFIEIFIQEKEKETERERKCISYIYQYETQPYDYIIWTSLDLKLYHSIAILFSGIRKTM